MLNHCALGFDDNVCVHYVHPDRCKAEETSCGFFRPVTQPVPKKERKEKWFEKYYK